ncbi:M55 family metallopeptidase [Clostridium sp.]
MKVYISADIEGITGVTSWSETEKNSPDYTAFEAQMNKEVKAACEGALAAGSTEICIKDAHDSGRNLDHNELPLGTKLIRGWSGHPFSMVQGLDESFDAAIFVGYHSAGGTEFNPLSHTMNCKDVKYIKINDKYANEFLLHAYAAATMGVPVVFVSGDKGLTEEVKKVNEYISTLAVKEGIGASTISIHPKQALNNIRELVEKCLKKNLDKCKLTLPEKFTVDIEYVNHSKAYRGSFYPGVVQVSPWILRFETSDYFEVLRMILFLT